MPVNPMTAESREHIAYFNSFCFIIDTIRVRMSNFQEIIFVFEQMNEKYTRGIMWAVFILSRKTIKYTKYTLMNAFRFSFKTKWIKVVFILIFALPKPLTKKKPNEKNTFAHLNKRFSVSTWYSFKINEFSFANLHLNWQNAKQVCAFECVTHNISLRCCNHNAHSESESKCISAASMRSTHFVLLTR